MRPVLIDRTPSRIDAIRAYRDDVVGDFTGIECQSRLASDCSLDSGVMSLVSSSARVVYAALAGDLAVAAAKFGASALSGSSAMLTEAIHSLVDSADQLLLLTVNPVPANPLTEPTLWGMAWKPISGPSSLPYSSFS